MREGVFVTGTGTDVGKTYVSALLVKTLREQGRSAGYFKPALSGARRRDGALIPGDAEEVCRMSGLPARRSSMWRTSTSRRCRPSRGAAGGPADHAGADHGAVFAGRRAV